jgi:DNA modification methylase
MYVDHLVQVFREARRVLRPDGTLWLVLGDTFMSHSAKNLKGLGGFTGDRVRRDNELHDSLSMDHRPKPADVGLKDKDLVGIPWRVALALQADGWWLRNAIVWQKKNPMPSSIQDRFTCSYEIIFMFTQAPRYYFDLDAVRVPHTCGTYDSGGQFTPPQKWFEKDGGSRKMDQIEGQLGTMAGPPRRVGRGLYNPNGKNPGDVWRISTQPYSGAHFAVFPEAIPERCILAGTSQKGCCPKCGSPWIRITERKALKKRDDKGRAHSLPEQRMGKSPVPERGWKVERRTLGWKPICKCGMDPEPCTVLDPFSGSATTGKVALRLGRNYVGLDLNEDYLPIAQARILEQKAPSRDGDEEPNPIADLFGVDN